jgi:hypothetical protein
VFEQGMPRIWGDERATRQIVLNLLSNSIKFTPQGGEIWLKVGWTASGGQYLSVKDTGSGACCPVLLRAGTNLTTTFTVPANSDWSLAIWKTNGSPATNLVPPSFGNTYKTIFNGTFINGSGANNTRLRNPAVGGFLTFPGDSLTMDTNTELRAKTASSVLNFPGTNGNPGLILNGGMLNGGDDSTFPITGIVQVASQSYISQGGAGGGGGISPNRAFNFAGRLTGTGNVVILNSGTSIPQQVSGASNTFSGQWIVQCGWLRGNSPGASGTNTLGTNSITVDPLYTSYHAAMPNATSPNGPAWFEAGYDMNSAGVLTLTNGGIMVLHQNCEIDFASVACCPATAAAAFASAAR